MTSVSGSACDATGSGEKTKVLRSFNFADCVDGGRAPGGSTLAGGGVADIRRTTEAEEKENRSE